MVSERLMVAFAGHSLPPDMAQRLAERPVAGVTLFHEHNVRDLAQVRALTAAIQQAAPATSRPLLIATDQEGGQLIALGPQTTQFAGPMALGATGDEDLAERVGRATARELRAVGVNVNYAPVCDLATEPANPALGIRSFGDDPELVGRMAAATVRGLQAEGVAATIKHFPGAGDTAADPHHELPVLPGSRSELEERELVPFRAAIAAGARLVMAGHMLVPGLDAADVPASLSNHVLVDVLRRQLGFDGLTVTDALDMRALEQGAAQVVDAVTALRNGEDLLLGTADPLQLRRLDEGLAQAEQRGLIEGPTTEAARLRLAGLRRWLAGFDQTSLDVIACSDHQALAAELARRSITLVRNDDGLLPLRLDADARVAVIQTKPANLTPADTSAGVAPTFAASLRRRLPNVDEFVLPAQPGIEDIGGIGSAVAAFDLVVVGTQSANLQPIQAALAQAVLGTGKPTVTVALRTPWDLPSYPTARTHVATYGILPPSMEALAAALVGEAPFVGRLPVEIGGFHPRGHGAGPWA